MKGYVYIPDLVDFINNPDVGNSLLTDNLKSRILQQFLRRFRKEFDTDLEYWEIVDLIIEVEKLTM